MFKNKIILINKQIKGWRLKSNKNIFEQIEFNFTDANKDK